MRPARALAILLVAAVLPAAARPDSSRVATGTDSGRAGAQLHAAHRSDTLTTLRFPEGWPFPADQTPVAARRGMVVSADSLASAAGLEVLRAGGNAVDAAIAVHFALAVVYPQAGNIGGGGFMVIRTASGRAASLDFREKAPASASRDMYLDSAGTVSAASRTGHLAAGVPGSVAGMEEAHRRFGSLAWKRLLAPAVRFARDGFLVSDRLHQAISAQSARLARFPSSAAIFLPRGIPPLPGTLLRQPALARTLQAIADSGAAAFYGGWIADSIAFEMRRGGGLISRGDLAAYQAVWREPIHISYGRRRLLSMGLPSAGGITLAEMLGILEALGLRSLEYHSADEIHLLAETMRRAYEDRNRYLGDPDFTDVPVEWLLGRGHLDSLRASIDPERATPSEARLAPRPEPSHTTHFSVIDSAGNAAAVTTTINGSFGAAVVVRGAGFLLNNEMDDFTSRPGVPNMYGLVQGEANAIGPGKRMLSAMTPTIMIGPDGRTELITGTPGGPTIPTSVLQVILGQVEHGLGVQQAVNAPRIHHQHLPDLLYYEHGGLEPSVVRELERRGHRLRERPGFSGLVQSIYIAPDGVRFGASDPRGGGKALGY